MWLLTRSKTVPRNLLRTMAGSTPRPVSGTPCLGAGEESTVPARVGRVETSCRGSPGPPHVESLQTS